MRLGALSRMCRNIHLPSIHHDTKKQMTIMVIALTSIIQRGYTPSHIKIIVSCVPSPEGYNGNSVFTIEAIVKSQDRALELRPQG